MIGSQQKYGSLKCLRSQYNINRNHHQPTNNQRFINNDKNAPVLNPQKKQSRPKYENFHNHFIKFQGQKLYNMRPWIYQLYDSTSYDKASLYGFNIRTLQNQLKNNQQTSLMVLWGLYQTLNWQNLSLNDLQGYINNVPNNEGQVEQVTLQNNIIKLNKLNMSLQIDIINNQFNLVPKKYQLNRVVGRNYQKSITKIVHQLKSYQFKGHILQIESNHLMIAVRTISQFYIINPQGKMRAFNIQTKDIAIHQNRCYFAKNNNTIGSIFIQTTYIPKLNEIAIEEKVLSDELRDGQFFVSNDQITLIVDVNIKEQSIFVRKMQGQQSRFDFIIEPQDQQTLVKKEAFLSQNHLYVLLFLGIGKDITKIISYKFFINC